MSDNLVKTAKAWWEFHRPIGWSLEQHLANPGVNTFNKIEKALALEVAKACAPECGVGVRTPRRPRRATLE
jgi:hypothetical protein